MSSCFCCKGQTEEDKHTVVLENESNIINNNDSNNDSSKLKIQCDELLNNNKQLTTKNDELTQENEKLNNQLKELNSKIKELTRNIEQLNNEKKLIDDKIKEYKEIQENYTRVDKTNDTFRKQLEEASIKENDLRSKIYALQEENKKLTQDLKKTRPYYRKMLRSKKTYVDKYNFRDDKNNNKSKIIMQSYLDKK